MYGFVHVRRPAAGGRPAGRNQQIEAPQEGSVISFHLEIDMFVGDDDNYTNGVRFAWMSGTTSRSHTFSGMLGTVLGGTHAADTWRRF